MERHIEGYWKDPYIRSDTPENSELPWPTPSIEVIEQKDEIIRLILLKQKSAEVTSYRGISICRLCQKMNGSQEYSYVHNNVEYVWPQGFIHYIEVHNVMPTKKFLDFLMNS